MVNIVKGYADHEKEIFGELAEARNTFAAASSSGDVSGVMAAESMLSQAMPKLLALSEAYPDLKAKTILITGGLGFLASQFIKALEHNFCKVIILDKKTEKNSLLINDCFPLIKMKGIEITFSSIVQIPFKYPIDSEDKELQKNFDYSEHLLKSFESNLNQIKIPYSRMNGLIYKVRDHFYGIIELSREVGSDLIILPKSIFENFSDVSNSIGENKVAFSDGLPLLMISESSLLDLNNRVNKEITMKRFRPNLVVKNTDPFVNRVSSVLNRKEQGEGEKKPVIKELQKDIKDLERMKRDK